MTGLLLAWVLAASAQATSASAFDPNQGPRVTGLLVSYDASPAVAGTVRRILRENGYLYRLVPLKVRTDRTAIYAKDPEGLEARKTAEILGGIPVRVFDWDSGFDVVVYLGADFQISKFATVPARSAPDEPVMESGGLGMVQLQVNRLAMSELPAPRTAEKAEVTRPVRADPGAWNDVLDRVADLEDRMGRSLGEAAPKIDSSIEETVALAPAHGGWFKVHGQPVEVASVSRKEAEDDAWESGRERQLGLIGLGGSGPEAGGKGFSRERLSLSVQGSILNPFGKTGQIFGQMVGLLGEMGYVWSRPWVVTGSIGMYSRQVRVIRPKDQAVGTLTLIPMSVSLVYPFRNGKRAQPYVGAGPALEHQRLSNRGVMSLDDQGEASVLGFGYEVKVGSKFSFLRKLDLQTELSWHAAEAVLAGSREGSAIRLSAGVAF